MTKYYTDEKNILILIKLMKENGIRKVVASPGTTNMTLVGSLQQDPYFQVYSSVDERSAAYIACGLAEESGEAVALSCTGATASRNYMSGLTEAFYRKLPILAITSTQHLARIGQNIPQVIDRSVQHNDTVKMVVDLPIINSEEDEWAVNLKTNQALLELKKDGNGPVLINLGTNYSENYNVKDLPSTRVMKRFDSQSELPEITQKRLGIFIGNHSKMSDKLENSIETFCEKYNCVVISDHTSNYKGKNNIHNGICADSKIELDLLIDIGNVSGSYFVFNTKEIWRVNTDGEVRDTYKKLTNIFQMTEEYFFNYYSKDKKDNKNTIYNEFKEYYDKKISKIPELPFSNIWVAKQTAPKLPKNSVLHLAILNSLRSWNFFEVDKSINVYSNTGGFGIDGCVSTVIGASLVNPEKLYFGVIGDLALFYDLNVLGNRHVSNNVRLLVINNGKGTEFRNYTHKASMFGEEADKYMAAGGHFGNKSENLIKNFAENLGYEYLSAKDKNEFNNNIEKFVTKGHNKKPIIFEVFTNSSDESNALKLMNSIAVDNKSLMKNLAKEVIGTKGMNTIKKIIKK